MRAPFLNPLVFVLWPWLVLVEGLRPLPKTSINEVSAHRQKGEEEDTEEEFDVPMEVRKEGIEKFKMSLKAPTGEGPHKKPGMTDEELHKLTENLNKIERILATKNGVRT